MKMDKMDELKEELLKTIAKYYENKGCCWLLEQNNFNTKNLFNLIIETIRNENKLVSIRENMKKNYNKNVYSNIENEIKEFI